MRTRQPIALDVREILAGAFAVRDTDPSYFGMWLLDALAHEEDGWHQQDAGPFMHHASAISQCLRQSVYERDPEIIPEERSVEALSTFTIGTLYHALLQMGLAVSDRYTLLAHEAGGKHGELNLKAHCDAVFEFDGELAIIDIKTESPFAPKMRRADAKASGRDHSARPEHWDQLLATIMVLQATRPELHPETGWIVYVDKSSGDVDQQQVPVEDVSPVGAKIGRRDAAWSDYALFGTLPDRLKDFPKGLCSPRSETDPRGKWCSYRGECLK
jgi:hypothetical protein